MIQIQNISTQCFVLLGHLLYSTSKTGKLRRIIRAGISILFITHVLSSEANAQTSGPSQPEVQSFQPASLDNLVEPASGRFQYNIPLFQIGQYPINLIYNSQLSMDQEAATTGWGFNINCGAITRQVRGLPDDFKGDLSVRKLNMKPNVTKGVDLGVSLEFFGLDHVPFNPGAALQSSAGIFYNSYTGFGIERRVGAGFHGNVGGLSGNAGIGLTSNSSHGTNVNPYVGFSFQYNKHEKSSQKSEAAKKTRENTDFKTFRIKTDLSGAVGYNFNGISYNPKIELPFKTVSADFELKAGFSGFFTAVGGDVRGYFVKQELETNRVSSPAYGFLYAESGKNDISALMDFNRENDGMMTETNPNLPLAFATPDVYSVAGQGIGGMFELKRNNPFIGFDPQMRTNNTGGGLEIELGLGTGAHVGADIRLGYTTNTVKKWNDGSNALLSKFDFPSVTSAFNPSVSEQTYFKNPADVMFNQNNVYNLTGGRPVAPSIQMSALFGGSTHASLLQTQGSSFNIPGVSLANQLRDKRTDVIYHLTAAEASQFGIETTIKNYPLNDFSSSPASISRVGNGRMPHHLSEMICLKGDGTRYVFNVPAYNIEKRDVSYSVNEQTDVQNYLANFVPNTTTPANAFKGVDDYVSVTETPAYAHSFLLGNVLSSDYTDVDNNGPTPNDLGSYVKFNYSRVYTDFYWRSNNQVGKGDADLGRLADNKDGKAYYSEGKKEIWILHSIETKSEVARFFYSDRSDAFELINGGARKLKKLDSIEVYSIPSINSTIPEIIKEVVFEYDPAYPLCKGVLNNPNQGKLTLKKVFSREGASRKGRYSAYTFSYNSFNPGYNPQAKDRWGNYKPNATTQSGIQLDNQYFPYVNQGNKPLADQYAGAWLLNSIELPGGGKIEVDYEAHDYAFVQNKRAMYMAPVMGASPTRPVSLSTGGTLYNNASNPPHNFITFKLKKLIPSSVSATDANNLVQQLYFTDNLDVKYGSIINTSNNQAHARNLYGKMRVQLEQPNSTSALGYGEEEIPVFLNVKSCGALKSGSGDYEYGYVELYPTGINNTSGNDANQISKTAWQFVKNNYPNILFGIQPDASLANVLNPETLLSLLSPVANVVSSIMQAKPNGILKNNNIASSIIPSKSFLRVYEPEGFKLGGNGARVKKVTIHDNWAAMSSTPNTGASYSIKYQYTRVMNGDTISSGVASYEPEVGGDENPWKQPVYFTEKNVLMPDDNKFVMTPFGESLFPGADIVYSEVKTIRNPVNDPNTQYGTGYSLNKFYTYYDFPCKVEQTPINVERKPKLAFQLLRNLSRDYMLATQGYSVITNDMHGKPNSEEVFGDAGNLISGSYYTYKTNNGELNNTVPSVKKDGSITWQNLLGVETQTYGDVRQFETESYTGSLHGNLDFQFIPPFFPLTAITVWPDFSYEQNRYSSFAITQHIRKQGILESVRNVDKGATFSIKNELWDQETGTVLLTSTNNEYKDSIYNFTYPAHWAYSGMGMACDNISASFTGSPAGVMHPGDILWCYNNTNKYKVTGAGTVSGLYNGAPTIGMALNTFKIINSGRNNQSTQPVGTIQMLKNPITGNQLVFNNSKQVLNAEAIEFSNTAAPQCFNCPPDITVSQFNNLNGNQFLAPWQKKSAYKFVDNRVQTLAQPDVRHDGYISNFEPFWNFTVGYLSKTTDPKWQFTEKVSTVSPKFDVLESVNPLNLFTTVQPSNFEGKTNAVAQNSRFYETFYDSFEDHVEPCLSDHYELFGASLMRRTNEDSHTGFYSLKLTDKAIYSFSTFSGANPTDPDMVDLNCMPDFSPVIGKKYILSAWVKEINASNTSLDYSDSGIDIIESSTSITVIQGTPKGQIIDGWQRIEMEFMITNPGIYDIALPASQCYLDDFRIIPADGAMKSYVYNYKDYTLMAILDENNYATFYEYDNQKQLKRVKKETEKGISTIQEVNFGSAKK